MKYVFAAVLVLLALVTVFHAEKLVPVPRAIANVMNSAVAEHMPFGIQTAYAESCITSLEGAQDRVRYSVSDATVRLAELDRRVADLREIRNQSVSRLKAMLDSQGKVSQEAVSKEVTRHDDIERRLTHAQDTRDRLGMMLTSLETAEGSVSQKLTQLNDRLEIVQLDHEHNNARELAAELADREYPGNPSQVSHGARVIESMEHKERVREEIHHRYGPVPINETKGPVSDPWERAREITETDC